MSAFFSMPDHTKGPPVIRSCRHPGGPCWLPLSGRGGDIEFLARKQNKPYEAHGKVRLFGRRSLTRLYSTAHVTNTAYTLLTETPFNVSGRSLRPDKARARYAHTTYTPIPCSAVAGGSAPGKLKGYVYIIPYQ